MKKLLLFTLLLASLVGFLYLNVAKPSSGEVISGAPPYDPGSDYVNETEEERLLRDWKRPDGPVRVALQVGHWKTDELPEELHRLRGNTGATGGGKSEWEVNYAIAERAKTLLEEEGVTVKILPATIPPRYYADVFVSIHADGNTDPTKTGYKAAAPRRDTSGKTDELLSVIEDAYEDATGLVRDPNVTRNMRGYYAFSWRRYEHTTHPMTPAVILETGFLTSPSDRRIIVSRPDISAQGLAGGILTFLQRQNLL